MKSLAFIISFLLIYGLPNSIKDEAEYFLRNFFPNELELKFGKYIIPKDLKNKIEKDTGQKFYKDFLYVWKIFGKGGHYATAILDNVYGKSLPITFIVIFDLYGKIQSVEIIKYREQYGGQVTEKRWLKQFNNRDSFSNYAVGNEISSISGATISVNSITKGVKKLTLLYNELLNSE